MEPWENRPEQGRPDEAFEDSAPEQADTAPLPQEEADAVLDELVAIASRMAVERAAQWSGREDTQREDRQLSFARSLLQQEEALRQVQPDFDLETLLRESPAFRSLILAGEPVERAYAYVRPDDGARRVEQEVLERIRKRNLRPQSMGMTGRPPEPSIEEKLSETEMQRIDAQLKRGRKVYLNY